MLNHRGKKQGKRAHSPTNHELTVLLGGLKSKEHSSISLDQRDILSNVNMPFNVLQLST